MAPLNGIRSAPTTPQSHITNNPRTPSSLSKHRQVNLISRLASATPGLSPVPQAPDHPVEVISRIREHPDGPDKPSVLQVLQNGHTVRVRTDQGYRDFGLDAVSLASNEDLQSFYKKYVESRIETVKLGGRCTIMMYGPTGAGKSHTMFGSAKEPGIAYRALQNILNVGNANLENAGDESGNKIKVTVKVLEIYNEDIFDLLATTSSGPGNWLKSRVRLEVMGKKAKNAISITGTDPDKISKEIAKIEKKRIIKSTACNERSSRSHCLVMVDVPSLGGRLVLVDMAGSENIEQAGVTLDLKMQTGKINQGNIALKRVVEAIANGDSYIPFRDSKLTMLLQDSFEDDEAKILMILCASPDPKDIHKTIGTLEYGSKAKCIVRLPASPVKEKATAAEKAEASVLEARIKAMDAYISRLEAENQLKDKEKQETMKELLKKEEDLTVLKKELERMEREAKEEVRSEMESRIKHCQRIAEEFIEMGKKKLEEKVQEQQREIETMQSRMEELEREVEQFLKSVPASVQAVTMNSQHAFVTNQNSTGTAQTLGVAAANPEASRPQIHDSPDHEICNQPSQDKKILHPVTSASQDISSSATIEELESVLEREDTYDPDGWMPAIPEEPEEDDMMTDEEELFSTIGENPENKCVHAKSADGDQPASQMSAASRRSRIENIFLLCGNHRELSGNTKPREYTEIASETMQQRENNIADYVSTAPQIQKDPYEPDCDDSMNSIRKGAPEIVNAGYETSNLVTQAKQELVEPAPCAANVSSAMSRSPLDLILFKSKQALSENIPPCGVVGSKSPNTQVIKSPLLRFDENTPIACDASVDMDIESTAVRVESDKLEVYVKWETSKESSGKLINAIRIKRNSTLADLRKELEKQMPESNHDFSFLMLGDPSGAPVDRESENALRVVSLPDCHTQRDRKLACLRPHVKRHALPLAPLENQQHIPSPVKPPCYPKSQNVLNLSKLSDKGAVNSPIDQQEKTPHRLSLPFTSPVKGLRL
uniref:Kinesin OrphII protein n=1 Tax=Marsilea vestita TaxID=59764 RepID=A0A142KWD8_MARVE|nr:kinesin OrphII protein [Marsilea vestita]